MSLRLLSVAVLSLLSLVAAAGSQAGPAGATSPPIVQISAGGTHTCAVVNQGSLKCWGSNSSGELGDGTYDDRSTPVDVVGLESGVLSVEAGQSHTCAVTSSGGVKCWGSGPSGQLGDGTAVSTSIPVDVQGLASGVRQVSAGFWHTCAVTTDGGVKCWGANWWGQIGDGTTTNRRAPVEALPDGSGALTVVAGRGFTCALMDDGGVECWGDNQLGQLGDGTTTDRLTPVSVVGLGGTAVAISADWWHTCVLLSAGTVQCWGLDTDLMLEDFISGVDFSTTPVDVPGLTDGVTAIAAGSAHSCAVAAGGAVKCWGNNEGGQLGDSAVFPSSPVPVDVTGIEAGVTTITAGEGHTCALTLADGMLCWGYNGYGELGNGNISGAKAAPVQVLFSPEADSDLDGCGDGRETGPDARFGGRRDPKSFWDFFDTPPRDGMVTVGDILGLVKRFGTSGDPAIDPLSTPPSSSYHPAFDRSAPAPEADPWDLGPADGSIVTSDILFVLNQFGHSCA